MADVRLSRMICERAVTIISHFQMHLDEILALWLIEKFATPRWLTQHCVNDSIMLGVGRGEFDEHPSGAGHKNSKEDCCATLVAKSLGVADQGALQQMLKFVFNADVKGAGHPYDLYNLVKAMNLMWTDEQVRVIDWTFQALEVKYAEQLEYVTAVSVVQSGDTHILLTPMGEVKVLVVHSDNTMIGRATRSMSKELKPDLLVIKNSKQQVQVFNCQQPPRRLNRVVRFLRIAEFRESKTNLTVGERELQGQEFCAQGDCWYYQPAGEMLLNGSITNPHVRKTRLKLEMILDCIRLGIQPTPMRSNGSTTGVTPTG